MATTECFRVAHISVMGALYIYGPRVGRWATLRLVVIPSAALLQPRHRRPSTMIDPTHSLRHVRLLLATLLLLLWIDQAEYNNERL